MFKTIILVRLYLKNKFNSIQTELTYGLIENNILERIILS